MNILHIMGSADAGGIAAVVLNYMRYSDQERLKFDVALMECKPGLLGQEMIKLGVFFYEIPLKSKGIKPFEDALRKILTEKHYDVIHVHGGDTAYVALRIAKQLGVKKRIAHSHSAQKPTGIRGYIRFAASAVLNPIYATDLLACGRLAGERTYGRPNTKRKKFAALPNAIDTERFAFREEVRKKMRKELGVTDRYVVGMVGRLSPQKNVHFALKIIHSLHEIMPEAIALIVGVGEEQEEIEETVAREKMTAYVRLLGRHADVEKYYQAFDVFLMPSLYEGFPVAAVEAMSSGLPVLLSDTITDELNFGEAVHYLPLGDASLWADELQAVRSDSAPESRLRRQNEVKANGFDIQDTVALLERIYTS